MCWRCHLHSAPAPLSLPLTPRIATETTRRQHAQVERHPEGLLRLSLAEACTALAL